MRLIGCGVAYVCYSLHVVQNDLLEFAFFPTVGVRFGCVWKLAKRHDLAHCWKLIVRGFRQSLYFVYRPCISLIVATFRQSFGYFVSLPCVSSFVHVLFPQFSQFQLLGYLSHESHGSPWEKMRVKQGCACPSTP